MSCRDINATRDKSSRECDPTKVKGEKENIRKLDTIIGRPENKAIKIRTRRRGEDEVKRAREVLRATTHAREYIRPADVLSTNEPDSRNDESRKLYIIIASFSASSTNLESPSI